MLIKRHPVAMLFVVAAYAFIGWQLRNDLAALAVVVGGLPFLFLMGYLSRKPKGDNDAWVDGFRIDFSFDPNLKDENQR